MSNKNSNQNSRTGLSRRDMLLTTAGAAGAAAVGMLGKGTEAQAAESGQGRLVVSALDASTANTEFIQLLRTGGVDCVHKSVGDLATTAHYYGLAYQNQDDMVIAKSVADIRRAKRDGKLSFILGAQVAKQYEAALFSGLGVLGSFRSMAKAVAEYKGLGVAIQGLCYNTTNVFGSGCLDHKAPLTRAGQRLVEQLHAHEILLDVGGHCGEQTSLDAINMSSGVPIVCTHTNMAGINPSIRAISDRMAEAIAATGGVIGITAVSAFHNRSIENMPKEDVQATLDDHMDQYDYVKRLVGVDHVGLGPDFIWGWGPNMPMDPEDSAAFPPHSMAKGVQSTVKGFEDTSKLPNLIKGLQGRGWTEAELDKLLGANWLRVFEQVWKG
jgi:membrane dipeptidase